VFVIDWDIRCVVFWLDEMRGGKLVVKRSGQYQKLTNDRRRIRQQTPPPD